MYVLIHFVPIIIHSVSTIGHGSAIVSLRCQCISVLTSHYESAILAQHVIIIILKTYIYVNVAECLALHYTLLPSSFLVLLSFYSQTKQLVTIYMV